MAYTNSPLVSYTKLSPNNSGQRTHSIDRITPHCVVGQVTVQTLGNIFANPSRQASSNYGIGLDGKVGMYVEEKNRSWCSSSRENDQRAITIECASDTTAPYAFKDVVYNKLIDLCVDICKRNGKKKLLWLGSKEKALSYTPKADEMILTAHRWFAATACPGEWMYSREADLAARVTVKLSGVTPSPAPTPTPTPTPSAKIDVIYQSHDDVKNKWLGNITNADENKGDMGYSGIFGHAIDGIRMNLSQGNVYYRVHTRNGKWLGLIKNRTDYAGIFNRPIDAITIYTDTGKTIVYQVHTKNGKWLGKITQSNINDSINGYAGIFGKEIDAIRIYIK